MTNTSLHAGIDIGSTTVKLAVLDSGDALVYSTYERHHADIRGALIEIIDAAHDELCRAVGDPSLSVAVTGSGGLSVSRWLDLPFVQEVIAGARAVSRFLPGHGCGNRAGRGGCEDHVLLRRPGAAHERHMRRRNGSIHRPDGDAPPDGRRGAQRAGAPPTRPSTRSPPAAEFLPSQTCSP